MKATTLRPGSVQTRAFRAGEVIFREGDDPRDEAYLVHAGRVDVRKTVADEQRLLRTYVKSELLGELGLFGGAPRSTTAVAAEPVTLVVIPAKRLHLAVAIIRDLSVKLRATNELLAAEGRRRSTPRGPVTSCARPPGAPTTDRGRSASGPARPPARSPRSARCSP